MAEGTEKDFSGQNTSRSKSSKSSSDSLDDEAKMLSDKEFQARKKVTMENRNRLIRSWLTVVEVYFVFRSCFIIWPKYASALEAAEDNNDVSVFEEVL